MRLDNLNIVELKTSSRPLKKHGGFTLIEVLIALTIFAVGLLAIAAMQTSAIQMNSTGNRITELSTLGIDRLEKLMSLPYGDPWLEQAGNPPGLDSAGFTHQINTADGYYQVSWTIADNTPSANTKSITLRVIGKGKRLTFSTIRAQSL